MQNIQIPNLRLQPLGFVVISDGFDSDLQLMERFNAALAHSSVQ